MHGKWLTGDRELKEGVVGAFKTLLFGDGVSRSREEGGGGEEISYLLFADDTMFFGEVEYLEELACEIGCKVGKLPSSYLRLPMGASYKLVAIWDGVKERFCKMLSLWKRQHLSNGGRLTLLRSTLATSRAFFANGVGFSSERDSLWKKITKAKFGRKKEDGA
ncbi:hypothetical protein CK203_110425 [Vitis vinifera]|uniref:Reverse transcriptase domain-containing protein n=1 Tax=Vitis vinifera TaxID=29760 RepID=A0A438CA86_VITVI|nr:hypothetical protein CK203_110425 [Vitis vinifera]